MKKKILNWTLVLSVFIVIAVASCKKTADTILACPAALSAYSEALEAFTNDPNKQTCEAHKAALQNYINECAPGGDYQDVYNDIDCSDL